MYGKAAALVVGLMWLAPMQISAERTKTKHVTVEYEYVAGNGMNPAQAKQIALQRAQLQAIADEFGTIISNTTTTRVENVQGNQSTQSNVQVLSLGLSDVRGEWVRTIGEPDYSIVFDDNLGMVVHVKVSGEIRERITAEIDLKVLTLRNGTTERNQDASFIAGDDLYLLFQAPTDGYLAVYLTDANDAYCLLPYQYQTESTMPIEKNREHIFFSIDQAPQTMKNIVDEYHLTCGSTQELNRIYIIFSPRAFAKAVDETGEGVLPRHLSLNDFHKWLGKARAYDTQMTCRAIDIDITPRN